MRLSLSVEHTNGTVDLNSRRNPLHLEAAAEAFRAFAFAADRHTQINVPGNDGPVVIAVGDIDRFDIIWETS